MIRFLFCFVTLVSLQPLAAQVAHDGFDSLVITKTKKTKYQMAGSVISSMELKWKNPKRSAYTPDEAVSDAARKLLTGIFHSGLITTEGLIWELRHEIQTNAEDLDWNFTIYCAGALEKTSEKIRNSDGSKSVNTEKTGHLFWDRGASAVLLEKKDTIAAFVVSVNPADDLFPTAGEVFSQATSSTMVGQYRRDIPYGTDYVLTGNFRQQPLQIFFNGNNFRAWIYADKKLLAIFQSDIINPGKKLSASQQLAPLYLLYRPGLTETEVTDCIRLAALSRLVATSVNKKSWDPSSF